MTSCTLKISVYTHTPKYCLQATGLTEFEVKVLGARDDSLKSKC